MNEPGLDERYVAFREHSLLSERVTRLEGQLHALLQMPAQLAEISAEMRALKERVTPTAPQANDALTNVAMAIHRLAETAAKPPQPSTEAPSRTGVAFSGQQVVMLLTVGLVLGALIGNVVGIERLFGVVAG